MKAFVVVKEAEAITEDEVKEFCKQHLASYKKPKKVRFLDSLPRNPAGKIMKEELKKM